MSKGRIKLIIKFCSVVGAVAALLFAAMGPADWPLGYYKRNRPLFVVLSLTLYAAILEIAQIWTPGRDPKFIDFAASSAGALIGSALAWIGLQATPSTRKKWGMLVAKTEAKKI